MSKAKDSIMIQYRFSEQFREKANIFDILFLLICLICPYFTKDRFIAVIVFSYLAVWYMELVINGFFKYSIIYSKQHQPKTQINQKPKIKFRN